jgi:hypothetical protein
MLIEEAGMDLNAVRGLYEDQYYDIMDTRLSVEQGRQQMFEKAKRDREMTAEICSCLNDQRASGIYDCEIGLLGGVIIDAAIDKAVDDLRNSSRIRAERDFVGEEIEVVLRYIRRFGCVGDSSLLLGRAIVSHFIDQEIEYLRLPLTERRDFMYGDELKVMVALRTIRNRASLYLERDPE